MPFDDNDENAYPDQWRPDEHPHTPERSRTGNVQEMGPPSSKRRRTEDHMIPNEPRVPSSASHRPRSIQGPSDRSRASSNQSRRSSNHSDHTAGPSMLLSSVGSAMNMDTSVAQPLQASAPNTQGHRIVAGSIIHATHHQYALGRIDRRDAAFYVDPRDPKVTIYCKPRYWVVISVTRRTLFALPITSKLNSGVDREESGRHTWEYITLHDENGHDWGQYAGLTGQMVTGACRPRLTMTSYIDLAKGTTFHREHYHPTCGGLKEGQVEIVQQEWKRLNKMYSDPLTGQGVFTRLTPPNMSALSVILASVAQLGVSDLMQLQVMVADRAAELLEVQDTESRVEEDSTTDLGSAATVDDTATPRASPVEGVAHV